MMSRLDAAPMGYTFDDFTIDPSYSEVKSRRDPDLSVNLPNFKYDLPVVSSPMNTVTETDMLVAMHQLGGVGVLHRYLSIESQVTIVIETISKLVDLYGIGYLRLNDFYVAVGANGDFKERVNALRDAGVSGFCVDVANGHNELSVQAVRAIRRLAPDARIMAGNVCTFDGALRLAEAGATAIRVGIGPGAVCTTRQVTGHGIPQLTAIEECARIKVAQRIGEEWKQDHFDEPIYLDGNYTIAYPDVAIIADGGIRKSGDIVKALAIGANAVMLGSLLAGTEETPGEWLDEGGVLYKYYHGMASDEGRARWMGAPKTGVPAEGVSKKIMYSGRSAVKVVETLCASTKVGLSFSGAMNVQELREKAKWRRVSPAGYVEGTPHGQ